MADRVWTTAEWYAGLTGAEALALEGSSDAVPAHFRADGAFAWAVSRGLLTSDSGSYTDYRASITALQAAHTPALGVHSTTSPDDSRITFRAYSWSPPDDGDTTHVIEAIKIQNLDDPAGDAAELIAQPGTLKVALMTQGAFELLEATDPDFHDVDGAGKQLPWWDDWAASQTAKLITWSDAVIAAGGTIDFVMMDTERNAGAWYREPGEPANWTATKADARWAGDLKPHLDLYGFDTASGTAPESRSNYEKGIWSGVVSKIRWSDQLTAVARTGLAPFGEDLIIVDYDARYLCSTRHAPMWTIIHYHGHGPEGNIVGDYQSRDLYLRAWPFVRPWGTESPTHATGGDPASDGDSWDGLLQDVIGSREMAAASTIVTWPWIAGMTWLTSFHVNAPENPYWLESIYHAVLTGNVEGFQFYNPDTQDPPGPDGSDILTAALSDLSDLVGYTQRRPLTLEPVNYVDTYVISGMDCGGRLVWRVTWDTRDISDPEAEISFPEGDITFDANGLGAWVVHVAAGEEPGSGGSIDGLGGAYGGGRDGLDQAY